MVTKQVAKPSEAELRARWLKRMKNGRFSPAVLGIGTIKVFGRAGDAPVSFPRIESLAALNSLEADERWAVNYAEQVVTQHQRQGRSIMGAVPGQVSGAEPVQNFDPSREYLLVLSQIAGG
jgi:hypothetical protein